jgi:hypothetical protein
MLQWTTSDTLYYAGIGFDSTRFGYLSDTGKCTWCGATTPPNSVFV